MPKREIARWQEGQLFTREPLRSHYSLIGLISFGLITVQAMPLEDNKIYIVDMGAGNEYFVYDRKSVGRNQMLFWKLPFARLSMYEWIPSKFDIKVELQDVPNFDPRGRGEWIAVNYHIRVQLQLERENVRLLRAAVNPLTTVSNALQQAGRKILPFIPYREALLGTLEDDLATRLKNSDIVLSTGLQVILVQIERVGGSRKLSVSPAEYFDCLLQTRDPCADILKMHTQMLEISQLFLSSGSPAQALGRLLDLLSYQSVDFAAQLIIYNALKIDSNKWPALGISTTVKRLLETRSTVTRYGDLFFAAHTSVGHLEGLRVVITLKPTSKRAVELELESPPDKTQSMQVDVCVVVSPLDFDLHNPNVQTIEVPFDADATPVIFKLIPKRVGRKTIAVEFFQNTRYLGRAEVETTVGEETRDSYPAFACVALALRAHQLAPDLTIYIEEIVLDGSRHLYRFLLLSPIHDLNLNFEGAGEIELQTAPEVYFDNIFAEINQWLREKNVDETVFFKRLNSLGANLYDQLFPEKLKRIYWEKLRGKVETIQIISADPWIPWELVRPYHPDALEEDDFLCEQFALTRWLAGSSSPDEIDFRKLALVMDASSLKAATREAEALRRLPGVQAKDISPSLSAVYDLLEMGGFDGLHFACHGEYDEQNPDQSVLLLQGQERFRPNDIAGKKRTFGREEPLVFLNACETGRTGLSLTGLGGWARAFIKAGASGFVGSMWDARSESAYEFAVAFYSRLLEGKTVAEATRLARQHIRRAGDPTWLSYTVYANPLARVAVKEVT